jgi:hypothetical protein
MSDRTRSHTGRPPVVTVAMLGYLACYESASRGDLLEELVLGGWASDESARWVLHAACRRGLTRRVERGVYAITKAGHRYLAKHGEVLNV